jgi:hypothetical protein
VKGPTVESIFHYACFTPVLKPFLNRPGDGRMQPEIPASNLAWALVLGALLRLNSANRLEWLVRSANRTALGLDRTFGDDALAHFTERLDPDVIRRCLVATLKLAKRNKVFDETAFLGLALDGTGAGRTTQAACPLCHPVKDAQGRITSRIHQFVMISVVGAGITLPFDIEPYQPGDSEYGAGKRLLKRAVNQLGARFADYAVADAKARYRALSAHGPGRGHSDRGAAEKQLTGTLGGGGSPLRLPATPGHLYVRRGPD